MITKMTLNERIEKLQLEINELREIANKEPLDKFPKTWEGLEYVSGIYMNVDCEICEARDYKTNRSNKFITPTEKEAESYLAACQLRQLAKRINNNQDEDEWVDWNNDNQIKYYSVYCYERKTFIILETWSIQKNSIYFKRYKDIERSLTEHKDLWLTYSKVSNNG